MSFDCKNLDEFLEKYGGALAQRARETMTPLHVPGEDVPQLPKLLRRPFEAQAHVIASAVKALAREKSVQLICEMGTGKTLMGMAVAHALAQRRLSSRLANLAAPPTGWPAGRCHEAAWETVRDMAESCSAASLADRKPGVRGLVRANGEWWVCTDSSSCGYPGGRATCWRAVPAGEYQPPLNKEGYEGTRFAHKRKEYALAGPAHCFWAPVVVPYRALVVCPGQLVGKWRREIEETIPGAKVVVIESWKDLLPLLRGWRRGRQRMDRWRKARSKLAAGLGLDFTEDLEGYGNPALKDHMTRDNKPRRPEWYIIGRDRLKLSSGWKPVYQRRSVKDVSGEPYWLTQTGAGCVRVADEGCCRCWSCGARQEKGSGDILEEKYFAGNGRGKPSRKNCCACKAPMWQETPDPRRYAPARLVQKHLRRFFDVGLIDEAHEYKGEDSLQADALGGVASACKKLVALTGTLIGGYAWHVRTLLFRIGAARTIVAEGMGWKDRRAWDEKYGRIEQTVYTRGSPNDLEGGHAFGRGGKKQKVTEATRPGVMPTMFKHLVGNSIFLGLDEVSSELPPFVEDVVPVEMDPELRSCYDQVDRDIGNALKEMVRKGDRRLLGMMLNCLLCYPDYPYGWGQVGYHDTLPDGRRVWVTVAEPANLDPLVMREKERALVDLCVSERSQGRQVWVYCQYTDKRDCIARTQNFLEAEGLRVSVMRASVKPAEREEWIKAHGKGTDVMLSHPVLVQTGLDFFDKQAGHNFTSIVFYQTGYNLFTLRQAARRAWRIGQSQECRVFYLYYSNSMQERAMNLMGRKLTAAQAVEGKFSSEGLTALAGDDANVEMALAKSLAERIQEGSATRAWAKLTTAMKPAGCRISGEQAEDMMAYALALARELEALGVGV